MKNRFRPILIGAAAVVLVALVLGIYGHDGGQGNTERVAPPQSGALAPLATGSLAGLVIKEPRPALPEAVFQDKEGAPLSLSAWKGRVVLVNLWATWCAPCRKEMPSLAALQKALGGADFEVVAISVDMKGLPASEAFLKETGSDALALYDDPKGGLLTALNAPGLPTTILIDRKGQEAARIVGPAEWNSPEAQAVIKALIAEAP